MAKKQDVYSIGKVSTRCNVSIKTLRYYDRIGLLVPACRKDDSNYRYYTHDQILTLSIIRKLRYLGVSVKMIKEIIDKQDIKSMEKCIQQRMDEIDNAIQELNDQYIKGQILLERLQSGCSLLEMAQTQWEEEEIHVEIIPLSNVLFSRRIKKDYKNSDVSVDRWTELLEMVSRYQLKATGSVILTYHNKPLEQFYQGDCDLEVSVQVNEKIDVPEAKEFGGFTAVTVLHIGRNEEIIQTHIKAIRRLNQQGYTIVGPISEEYIISPLDVKDEENHITKVIIPVQKID